MRLFVILFFALSFCFSQDEKYQLSTVAFYNVENLFDTIDDPNNGWDESMTPKGKDKWTEKKYKTKIDNLSKVISGIGKETTNAHPTIVGLCEVENRNVLIDLVQSENLKDFNYGIVHFDSPDWRGIDVALIFDSKRFIPRKAKTYPLKVEYKGNPSFSRDILVVFGFLDKEPINFIVNHWPSRSGGQAESEPQRVKAAEVNKRIIDSIQNIDINAKIISMGDFNDHPDDKSLKILTSTYNKEDIQTPGMFNPMQELSKRGRASYLFRGFPSAIDQFVISNGLISKNSNLVYLKADVYMKRFLYTQEGRYRGYPARSMSWGVFNPNGYSDHLPIFLFLGKKL